MASPVFQAGPCFFPNTPITPIWGTRRPQPLDLGISVDTARAQSAHISRKTPQLSRVFGGTHAQRRLVIARLLQKKPCNARQSPPYRFCKRFSISTTVSFIRRSVFRSRPTTPSCRTNAGSILLGDYGYGFRHRKMV